MKCGVELHGKRALGGLREAADAIKKYSDTHVRCRALSFYQVNRLRGRASGAAAVYMPPEPRIVELSMQVSAYSLISSLIVLHVERERANVAAPHRLDWPQPCTAS